MDFETPRWQVKDDAAAPIEVQQQARDSGRIEGGGCKLLD
jgi:hypothetical protein